MHALKQDTQEVVQGHDEGVGPLARKVGGEGGVGVWGWQEGQDNQSFHSAWFWSSEACFAKNS